MTPSAHIGGLPVEESITSRKYPSELRERAVRLYLESGGRPIAHVGRDLGIDREALRQWVRQAEADATPRA